MTVSCTVSFNIPSDVHSCLIYAVTNSKDGQVVACLDKCKCFSELVEGFLSYNSRKNLILKVVFKLMIQLAWIIFKVDQWLNQSLFTQTSFYKPLLKRDETENWVKRILSERAWGTRSEEW